MYITTCNDKQNPATYFSLYVKNVIFAYNQVLVQGLVMIGKASVEDNHL